MTFALLLSTFALAASDVTARANSEPKTVTEFYEAYKRYGLWLPPKDAKLVRWEENHFWSGSGGFRQERIVHLRLMIRPKAKDKPALLRDRDYEFTEHRDSRLKVVRPNPDQLKDVDLQLAEYWLEFAAQAHDLGWTGLATIAFERGRVVTGSWQYPDDVKNNPCHTLTMLRRHAWRYYYDSLHDAETDLAASYSMLKRIHDDDAHFRTEFHAQLLEDLDKSIRGRKVQKVGIEKLIDGLCDLTQFQLWDDKNATRTAYDELAQLGFAAVPSLIRHLDDTRTTRIAKLEGFNNGLWNDTRRVGSLCRDLLYKLSGGEIDSDEEATPAQVRQLAERWYAETQKIGEEKWAVDRAINENRINDVLLQLLVAKYPKRFDELFRDVLKNHSQWHIQSFMTALIRSRRPRNEQISLLRDALATNHPNPQYGAVRVLRELDIALYRSSLLVLLRRIAKEIETIPCQYHELLDLVEAADDPACWTAFDGVLGKLPSSNRIDVGWRLVSGISYRDANDIRNRLSVIESLWNDNTIRQAKDVGHFPFPSYEYPELAVQDGITLAVADQLDIGVPWKQGRSVEEWAMLREQVRAKLAEARKEWEKAPKLP